MSKAYMLFPLDYPTEVLLLHPKYYPDGGRMEGGRKGRKRKKEKREGEGEKK